MGGWEASGVRGRVGNGRNATLTALILTPRAPWPLDDGGRIAMWQTVWAASREFRTTLVSLVSPSAVAMHPPAEAESLGIRFVPVPHTPPPAVAAIGSGLWGPLPYTLARYRNRALHQLLHDLAGDATPDFVLANHLHMLPFQASLPTVPWIYRAHNVEAAWMHNYASGLPAGPRRWFAEHQSRRLAEAERRLCRRMTAVLAIQEEEAACLAREAPEVRVETLPLGIDLARYAPPAPVEPPVLLLPGTFSWPPNADGAMQFLRRGWPILRRQHPTLTLRLAGKDPSVELQQVARDAGAHVAGFVESMSMEMSRAAAVLVPLWAGAGVRVKIVEAMAAGAPVVSTRLGADGLGLVPGQDYLLGDTPEELAARVSELLASDVQRHRLSMRGLQTVRARWSLDLCAGIQNRICREVAARPAPPPGPGA